MLNVKPLRQHALGRIQHRSHYKGEDLTILFQAGWRRLELGGACLRTEHVEQVGNANLGPYYQHAFSRQADPPYIVPGGQPVYTRSDRVPDVHTSGILLG